MMFPQRRLVIVVRADPVICGHSGEARNLAEVALTRGFDDVRLLTWPIATLQAAGLPLKPLDRLLPYSPGITVAAGSSATATSSSSPGSPGPRESTTCSSRTGRCGVGTT